MLRIKRRIKVLDNPTRVLDVLKAREAIKEGLVGNHITQGPNQYRYTRSFLAGEALRVFNEKARSHTGETVANLNLTMNELVTFFTPRECLSKQKRYIRYAMRKPYDITTRQYIGSVRNLNERCVEMPPHFNATQKLTETELVDIVADRAPKSHKKELVSDGFNPETATLDEFVETCERAETNEAIDHGARSSTQRRSKTDYYSDDSRKKSRHPRERDSRSKTTKKSKKEAFYCRYHKANDSHDTTDCKVINGREKEGGYQKNRSDDYKKDKYKKKYKELHVLQEAADKEKKRYQRARAKLSKNSDTDEQNAEDKSKNDKRTDNSSYSSDSESDSIPPMKDREDRYSDDSSSSSESE